MDPVQTALFLSHSYGGDPLGIGVVVGILLGAVGVLVLQLGLYVLYRLVRWLM